MQPSTYYIMISKIQLPPVPAAQAEEQEPAGGLKAQGREMCRGGRAGRAGQEHCWATPEIKQVFAPLACALAKPFMPHD